MIESNELRGSLVNSNEGKGALGFKGERGYSAYEIAVQHGFEGTEEDWLATLGTSSHFSKDVAVYETTAASTTEFNTPITVATGDFVDVYVNGFKLNENEYTFNTTKVTLTNPVLNGNTVEVIVNRMSTNNLPISTTITSSSTNDTASGTKSVYDYIETLFNRIYPVGSIYMSVNSTSPATLFGGTWVQIKGRYLLGAGAPSQNTNTNMGSLTQEQLTWNFTAGETLGEFTHPLTTAELPNITGTVVGSANIAKNVADAQLFSANGVFSTKANNFVTTVVTGVTNPTSTYVNELDLNIGGGQVHNTMSAALVVYMWKRTA